MEFDELRKERKALNNFVGIHRESIEAFRHPERAWFLRDVREEAKADDPAVDHLSTTASCLESLNDVPVLDGVDGRSDRAHDVKAQVARTFATEALDAAEDEDVWSSEGAARVYCRVRTVPALLRFAPEEVLTARKGEVDSLIGFVWDRVDAAKFTHQGVAEDPIIESTPSEPTPTSEAEGNAENQSQTYPPNAFNSYWAIQMLNAYATRGLGDLPAGIRERRQVVHLWAEKTLAAQAALIRNNAQLVDAHQLAWALATDVNREPEQPATSVSPRRELYDAALKAFFNEQLDNGNWRRYEPLFHYPKAGNAYCYTFETLTELIRPALERDRGRVLRSLLHEYADKLVKAWHFAEETAIELERGGLGWCSGHHPQRTDPEAWATAAVFSYIQVLRRLIGVWTKEAAKDALAVGRPQWPEPKDAREKLMERGDTWADERALTAGRRLSALFLHPVVARAAREPMLDPDRKMIASNQARSAILFGPPGTSKTTLVEAMAGAIDWEYVEIHASDFLRQGMDRVPAIADEIFAQLMELDSCVVLFDEIDELIRQREQDDSDPFGRFLTTSMLPKIAKLWDQRRMLFFVATNHIDSADPAIRRSQRFDAAMFVAPPSFNRKTDELQRYLGAELPSDFDEAAVAHALQEPNLMEEHPLGVFALLRFDQMAELADRIRNASESNGEVDIDAISAALSQMGIDLARTEWSREANLRSSPGGAGAVGASDQTPDPFALYHEFKKLDRRDYRRQRLIRFESSAPSLPDGWRSFDDSLRYLELSHPVRRALETREDGRQRLNAGDWQALDDGLLNFTVSE